MKTKLPRTLVSEKLCLSILLFCLLAVPYFALADTSPNSNDGTYGVLFGSSVVTETYCGACNGAIDLTITGGQMPYTYNWNNGATTEDLDNVCLGLYNVTVTDATGCTYTDNIFVGNNSFPDVYLETQAEVDDYVANFSFCNVVNGTLRIGTTFANPPSDITDISGLSFITSVGSSLQIFQNNNLSSLDGLQNITSLGGALNITTNNSLTNLVGLPPLTAINGSLAIDNLSNLQSLEGLNQVTSVGGTRLYISNAPNLTSLSALSQLQSINGDLDIRICFDLVNLNGLEQLTSIGGDLVLQQNFILSDISALDHTLSINGNLVIKETELSACAIEPICTMLDNGASADLANNNTGCNTTAEILDACAASAITVDLAIITTGCAGDCNGSISILTVSGGTDPYTYAWSNGETTSSIMDLCSGNYELSITDAEDIMATFSYQIAQQNPLTADFTVESMACFGQCTGSINPVISGGTPPYEFDMLFDICPGDYTIMVTDSEGCTSEGNFTMTGSEAINVSLDGITDELAGLQDGAIDITVTGGTGPLSFEWQSNGVTVSTDEDPSDLAGGDYTLLITDGTGCTGVFDTYFVDIIMSINDFEVELGLSIHPNPANDFFQVEMEFSTLENINYSLWNAAGLLMKSGRLLQNGGSSAISVENLSNGVYFFKLEIEDKVLVKKLIVE